MARLHPKTSSLALQLGRDIQTWRKIQRLTATVVAERADISRTTLRSIESDPTSAFVHWTHPQGGTSWPGP